MKLRYSDIKKMNPETMSMQDILDVQEYTRRTLKEAFRIQLVGIFFQLLALAIGIYSLCF